MPFNDLLVPNSLHEFAKIRTLLADLIQAYKAGAYSTREELYAAYTHVLSIYQDTINTSLFYPEHLLPDTEPDVAAWNLRMQGISQDLQVLFIEMNALGLLMTSIFNQQVSEADDLTGRVKRISSKLGDYQLITGTGGVSFGESFANTENLDVGSTLVSTEECTVNTIEGALTLKEKSVEDLLISSVSVDGNNSNGTLGNSLELNQVDIHNDLSTIQDNRADTWVEYEKTYFQDENKETLRLRLSLRLQKRTIVNRITIDPVNHGQLDLVKVKDIRVSTDGENWISIIGDLPLAEYLGESVDNTLALSPETAKYTGKLQFTFLPRKVSHISIDFEQNGTYLIETSVGSKYRQVIGLKSIDVASVKFTSNAQIVSKAITTTGPVTKLGLIGAYRPINSSLGSVGFSVSTNGGTDWSEIQPLTEDDLSAAEIIDIDPPVDNFLYKIILNRDSTAFSELDTFDETGSNLRIAIEHRQVSLTSSPAIINPTKQLANEDVVVVNGPIGSVGTNRAGRPKFSLGFGIGDAFRIKLPFSLYPKSDVRKSGVSVFVHGDEWTQTPSEEALNIAAPDARVYYLSNNGIIVFGNGEPAGATGNGKSPTVGAEIEISLPVETLSFKPVEGGWVAQTGFSSFGSKKSTDIERLSPLTENISEVLPQGKTEIELSNNVIDEDSFKIYERNSNGVIAGVVYTSLVGSLDLVVGAGDYYIDYDRGIVHSYSQSFANRTTTVVYKYYPLENERNYRWRLDDLNRYTGIFISNEDLVSHSQTDYSGQDTAPYGFSGAGTAQNVTYGTTLRLSHGSILRGTLVLSTAIFGSSTPTEVGFANGHKELHRLSDVSNEIISGTNYSSFPTTHTFQLAGGANIFEGTGLTFSDTSKFLMQYGAFPGSPIAGDWHLNYATGIVTVELGSNLPDDITVSYKVFSSTDTSGLYSVDYENGIVYCVSQPIDDEPITYEYTKYRINYPIGITLDSDDVEVNATNNTLSINTENLETGSLHFAYQYNGTFDTPLTELIEYYTPLVRDIRWRYLTSGMTNGT